MTQSRRKRNALSQKIHITRELVTMPGMSGQSKTILQLVAGDHNRSSKAVRNTSSRSLNTRIASLSEDDVPTNEGHKQG